MKRALVFVALVAAGAAQAAADPHAQARSYLTKCRDALAPIQFKAATKQTEPRRRRFVVAAQSACGDGAKLKAFANLYPADDALQQAKDAEVGIAEGLANYRTYLDDVAAGKTGHTKIMSYATEQVRQGRLLLGYALAALK